MGQWHISIRGTGQHNNGNAGPEVRAKDAEVLAEGFVKQLREAGHQVDGADFTSGGRQDLGK